MTIQVSHILAPSFTRPNNTTAYADGDLVANSTTAGSVVPLVFVIPNRRSCIIRGASVAKTDETDVSNALFTLHLFRSSPTVANGDNGALSTNIANKIGTINVGQMVAYTDDAYVMTYGGNFYVDSGSATTIYGLLEVDGAYAPAAEEVFTVGLVIEQ